MHLQGAPSHVGVPENIVANRLEKTAHQDQERKLQIRRLVEAKRLIRGTLRVRRPDTRLAAGIPPLPMLRQDRACGFLT